MSRIYIVDEDILDVKAECIVNATNESMWCDTPLENRIFRAAGTRELTEACDQLCSIPTGNAAITPGFNTGARYIIQAVGPRWRGGSSHEAELLDRVYRNALALVVKNQCSSVVFSLISAEMFLYPVEDAWKIALHAVNSFLRSHEDNDLTVYFSVMSAEVRRMGRRLLAEMEEKYRNGQDISLRLVLSLSLKVNAPVCYGTSQERGRIQVVTVEEGELSGRDLDGNALHGSLLPGASDLQKVTPDGRIRVYGRYAFRLDDGRSLFIETEGLRTVPEELAPEAIRGSFVAPDRTYFASSPTITVFDDSLKWMERHRFICRMMREKSVMKISYFMVEK